MYRKLLLRNHFEIKLFPRLEDPIKADHEVINRNRLPVASLNAFHSIRLNTRGNYFRIAQHIYGV